MTLAGSGVACVIFSGNVKPASAGVRPPLEEEDFVSREASNDTPPRRARSLKNGPHRIVQELGEGRQRSHKRREVPALVPELENAVFAFCEKKTSSII